MTCGSEEEQHLAPSSQTEKRLVRETAEKNEESFRKLIMLYQNKIKSFAAQYAQRLSESSDDLAQDIFLQIYLSAAKYQGDSSVSTWVYSITKYTINNKLRKKNLIYLLQFWKKNPIEEHENELPDSNDPEKMLMLLEENKNIKKAIDAMDSDSREILMLYIWSGLSYEQISHTLNINIGTVKSRLNKAKNAMKKEFKFLEKQFSIQCE